MKIRRSILLFCIAVVALTVLVVWFAKGPAKTLETIASPKTVENVATPAAKLITNAPIKMNQAVMSVPVNMTNAPRKDKGQQTLEILSTQNDIPIVFYGKIQDQFGNAIGNATVNFDVRVYNGVRSSVDRGQTASDANGLFTISGYKGESLGISVKKEGYALVSMNGTGIYSKLYPEEQRAHPDPNNPTVIKMWKLQGAEPLVSIDQKYKLPYNGEPIFFDLVTGKVVPVGGDLEVVITRAPGVITQRKENRRDWSIKLVPVYGGIMESDYLAFEAPADGYQESYQVQMNHDDPAWFDNIRKVFFLKSRNGQIYSKFSMDFGINDDPNGTMWFQFNGVANTNSSRNWEATAPQ